MRKMFFAAMLGVGVAAAYLLVAAQPAMANCASLTAEATASTREADASMIRRDSQQEVTAENVGLVLEQEGWRLVWATPKNAERGVFFFKKAGNNYQLIDIWGGVFGEQDRADGVEWATKLNGGGFPSPLAECFADAVVAGE